jgi:type IV pilus assembly protein PilV
MFMKPIPSNIRATMSAFRSQAGVTMIELLVSILLFAFGMLGLVGMQSKAVGYGQFSLLRSQASALSDDVFDRMRADRANAKLGSWNTELTDTASSITGSTLTETDLKSWKTSVSTLLPSGRGAISLDGNRITVTIDWNERGSTTTFTTTSVL